MVCTPNRKQSLLPLSFFQRTSYTRRPSPPAPELPPSAQTTPEPAELPTLASSRGKREQGVYKKKYFIPLDIGETVLATGAESGREKLGNLGVKVTGVSVKKKVKSPEMGEVISVKKDLRMEMERREWEEREKERNDRGKGDRQQRERAKREREELAGGGRNRKKRRTAIEIQDTDADDDDLISPVDARRDSNATDSRGGGLFPSLENTEAMDLTGMEAMDLTGMEDSADSDYVEEVSEISSDQEEEKEDEEDEEDEDEEIIGTPKRKKILLDSSQSSLSPLHSPSLLPRTFKPQKGRPPTYVLKREPRYSGRKHANDFYESSDSRSISPSARPLTPRGRNRRVSPHIIASKSKKQRTNCSRYTLSPINTELTSPFPSRHRSRSPVNTSRSPISQPPCLRMSLTGNDDEIFTIPLSEVLTPAELETAIQTHFPQPADTYIKLTDDRGDIIKLSFWKGGVWKDGLRVRVEYRDNTSGESRSRTSSGAALWPRSTTEKSVKVGMVDAGVQTQGVEVYDIGWAEKREAKIVEELTERLKKVDRVIVERAEMKVKEKRKSMEQELREEKERLHQKQKQREKELEEQGLELQFGSQAQVKEVPPLLSAGAPPKSEVPMPTPNTSAHTSRNSSTDLATPTKLQFAALSLSLATARRDPPPKQRQPAQQQKASPKKWSPSTDADEGNDSGSDLSLDLSWDSSKRVASAEKQKSKSKPKPRGEHHNTSIAAAGGGGSLEVPSWVLSSAKKQKNRECSISLNSTPPRLKGKSSASASKAHPASTQSQEELSLFIGSQLTDSSAESSPGVGPPLGDGLTPPEEVRRQTASPDPALVTHSKEPAVRKGGTPICLARRSGKAGLARGGGVLGSVVGTGRSSGTETTEAGEGGSVHQEWYTLGGWVAQRPGEMDL